MSVSTLEQLLAAGMAHHQRGEWAQAEAAYRQALQLRPDDARVSYFLSLLEIQRGNHGAAEELARQAVALDPGKAAHVAALGEALRNLGRLDEAIDILSGAAARFPDSPWIWHNLGFALVNAKRWAEAVDPLQRGARLRPNAQTLRLLGNALSELSRNAEAEVVLRQAVSLEPANMVGHAALGDALYNLRRLPEAMASYREALRLAPDYAPALNGMASICQTNLGDVEEAVAFYRRAMAADPVTADYHSNLLLAMHYRSTWGPEEIFQEHLAWAKAHAQYAWDFVHAPRAGAPRRLRVGYVSGDFRNHAVAYFWEAIAKHHDHRRVEVFCYSDVDMPDDATHRLQGYADHWRDIALLSNAQAAEAIYRDQIDILVDLTGHSGRRRLKVFARKPAPIQATYLGYPDTTGLEAMDYRLVDAVTDPVGLTEQCHTERLERLPGCFLCYTPLACAPDVGPPPCLANGGVTFASFNNFAKISEEWVVLASRILKEVPGSKCMVKSTFFSPGDGSRERVARLFSDCGIGPERLILLASEPSQQAHLARYNEVDIALDTFPYNGTTTTCEALWMGVPVVALAGQTHVSRVSASLLTAIGLPELVAATPEAYVRIAVELAKQPQHLRELRRGMRGRMQPITDGSAFAAKLEDAYQGMFERWQAAAQGGGLPSPVGASHE